MRCAAFNTGTEFHMLDHIAPLAELMQMPLIVTEELNDQLARHYYPQVQTRLIPDLEFRLGEIAEQFDALFECKFWGTDLKALFQHLYKKEMRLIFCPHGQSDKGLHSLAQYPLQDIVLLYGGLLKEMLQNLQLPIRNSATVGNYRLQFYRKHQSFYDNLADQEIFSKLNPKNRTLLYAPTWKDGANSTSFFDHCPNVLSQLPSDWNLIIKLHPLLEQRDPAHFYSIAALADKNANALLINEFPPVYPILARVDAYLGDFSSVGYDFLAFQRPLFFLPTTQTGKLHSCGRMIDPTANIYAQLDKPNDDKEKQRKLYEWAFGENQKVQENILRALKQRALQNQ
jgi:hypothetical protein